MDQQILIWYKPDSVIANKKRNDVKGPRIHILYNANSTYEQVYHANCTFELAYIANCAYEQKDTANSTYEQTNTIFSFFFLNFHA